MKRSEIVESLATFLDHDYNEDADQIIAFLEKEGMLPPPTLKTTLGQWEPEDEKK